MPHYLNKYTSPKVKTLEYQQLNKDKAILIDVRSEGEHLLAKIPHSISIPLFDNQERKEIGILYKNLGKQNAIELGSKIIDERLSQFLEQFNTYKNKDQPIVIYCARGGMRSASVTALLSENGFDAFQLKGGFKSYRNYTVDYLNNMQNWQFIILHGQTGVGKTKLINLLDNSLDLEGLAQHRSSLFGAVNKTPRTQKNFDGLLVDNLTTLKEHQPVFVEGESRKIGNVSLSTSFFNTMRASKYILLTASIQTRVQVILDDYVFEDTASQDQLFKAINSLNRSLGNKAVDALIAHFKDKNYPEIVRFLLVNYYDPLYNHTMKNYRYELTLDANNIEGCKTELIKFKESLKTF